MSAPFDNRLKRLIRVSSVNFNTQETAETKNAIAYDMTQMPFSTSTNGYNQDYITAAYTRPSYEIKNLENGKNLDKEIKTAEEAEKKYQADTTGVYQGTASIMNPYSMTRLYGSKGGTFLVDSSLKRKYYEIDGDDSGHYAKNPSTSNIIKWGAMDSLGRHPYQYQDFVFCKHWNNIPNNRLITLRRFASPTYDNLNFPFDTNGVIPTMHPIATALTYFGEGTGNKLSDLLKFTAGYGWADAEGKVWEPSQTAPSMSKVEAATGWNKVYSSGIVTMATLSGLVGENNGKGNESFDFNAEKGLPTDPYSSGPYANRILGPVNKICHTKKRDDTGLKFGMDGLTITFDYMARPIGGINPKAALLDVLANFLVLGYSSAVWFGGAHRFMIEPTRYPFTDNKARQALWQGKILGDEGAAAQLVRNFKNKLVKGVGDDGVGNIFSTLGDTAAGLFGDLLGTVFGSDNSVAQLLQGRANNNAKASNMKTNIEQMFASSIQAKVGAVPYLSNMYSILTGDPVGDWHLVIGNPMNPIAEIGNLVCENITITFSDELGPDDFPIGFTAQIKLQHGMGRDRDGIEAIFNKGAGRIYELPDKFYSSADGQTDVDPTTSKTGSAFTWRDVPAVKAQNTYSIKGQMKVKTKDAYTTIGTPGFIENTVNMRNAFATTSTDSVVHTIMPWQTKIVL